MWVYQSFSQGALSPPFDNSILAHADHALHPGCMVLLRGLDVPCKLALPLLSLSLYLLNCVRNTYVLIGSAVYRNDKDIVFFLRFTIVLYSTSGRNICIMNHKLMHYAMLLAYVFYDI